MAQWRNYAALRGVTKMPKREEFVSPTAQWRNYAALRDVPIKLGKEEHASRMVL
jgi:hypothetical protein